MLELDVRIWGLKLYSLIVNKEGDVGQPFTRNDVGENHEGDEINFGYNQDLMSMKNDKMMITKVLVRHSSSWIARNS